MVSHFGVLPLFDVSPLSLFRERRGSGVGQAALCEGGAVGVAASLQIGFEN